MVLELRVYIAQEKIRLILNRGLSNARADNSKRNSYWLIKKTPKVINSNGEGGG